MALVAIPRRHQREKTADITLRKLSSSAATSQSPTGEPLATSTTPKFRVRAASSNSGMTLQRPRRLLHGDRCKLIDAGRRRVVLELDVASNVQRLEWPELVRTVREI